MSQDKRLIEFVKEIKEHIVENDLRKACDLIRNATESKEGILWSARLKRLDDDLKIDLINNSEHQRGISILSSKILEFVDSLKVEDIILQLEKETIQSKVERENTSVFVHKVALDYLANMNRVKASDLHGATILSDQEGLLFPEEIQLIYTIDDIIEYKEQAEDRKNTVSELVSIIAVEDALNISYQETGVISVRSYLKKLEKRPKIVTVQAMVLCEVNKEGKGLILDLIQSNTYNTSGQDSIWIENSDPNEAITQGDLLLLMNRRVGGWSGSIDDPKIELLLGGGVMPTIWDDDRKVFSQMSVKDVIQKEFEEELKYKVAEKDIEVVGGFINEVSQQLVILCMVFVKCDQVPVIQKGALNNVEEKIDGIFLGRVENVLKSYFKDASPFAGGKEAVKTNFPSQSKLMKRVENKIYDKMQVRMNLTQGNTIQQIEPNKLSDTLLNDDEFSDLFEKVYTTSISLLKTIGLGIDWQNYIKTIDEYAYAILKPELSAWGMKDIYCLCCSIYLHRIGLIGKVDESPAYVFGDYSDRSRKIILDYKDDLYLNTENVEDIAWIVFGHKNVIGGGRSIDAEELQKTINGGKFSRQKISFYLKMLTNLTILNTTIPKIVLETFHTDKSSSFYTEILPSQIFSNVNISGQDKEKSIQLEVNEFKPREIIPILRVIMQTQKKMSTEVRRFKDVMVPSSFFSKWNVIEVNQSSLSKQVQSYINNGLLIEDLSKAILKGSKALIEAKESNSNVDFNGWGPYFVVKHEEEDFNRFSAPRVVNTFEVLLALSNFKVYEKDLSFRKTIKEKIQETVLSINEGRISKVASERKEELESKISALDSKILSLESDSNQVATLRKRKKKMEMRYEAEINFNPFTSFTNRVPTIRVNSIPLITFSELLESRESHFLDKEIYDLILPQMKSCVEWICKTDSNPFDEKDMFISKHIFKFVISIKSLVRSEKYWEELGIDNEIRYNLYNKVIEFTEHFISMPRQEWPKTTYKAMALEIFLFYLKKSGTLDQFNKGTQVKSLISEIVESLFDELQNNSFKLWENDNDIIYDLKDDNFDDANSIREWTHITSIWVVDGLSHCYMAKQLNDTQHERLLEIIPLLLLDQENDGFFDSISESTPVQQTTKFIYKTALYIHALNLTYRILQSKE